MSNLGKWSPWYKDIPKDSPPRPYGNTPTYRMGAEWLTGCRLVADWGCGMGFFKTVRVGDYIGYDGTPSPFATYVCDLATVKVPAAHGIFMRGVLEHNPYWHSILINALTSFQQRMCLVLFTPMSDTGEFKQLKWIDDLGVPDLSLPASTIVSTFKQYGVSHEREYVTSDTGYGGETVFYLWKGKDNGPR